MHRRATILLSAAMVLLGIAIVVRTVDAGGGPLSIGMIMGVLFIAAGAARGWFTWRNL
jgi:hypothetical protein